VKTGRVTMQDVADKAQVSKTAVSMAFNDNSRLSEATLKHILDTAAELGYSQDPAARTSATRCPNSSTRFLRTRTTRNFCKESARPASAKDSPCFSHRRCAAR